MSPPKHKKRYRKKWTGEMFALYLLNKDVRYVLPTMSAAQIVEDLYDEIGIREKAVTRLIESPEFEKVVRDEFINRIKNKKNLELTTLVYLDKLVEKNLKSSRPNMKLLEFLAAMSGVYDPKVKPKPIPSITKEQWKQMIKARNNAERKKGEGDNGGKSTI